MSDEYVRLDSGPPPQLTRPQLAELTPEQIVKADALGQLDVIKSGRTPTDHEQRGERWATEAERVALAEREKAEADTRRGRARLEQMDALRVMRD